MKALLLRIKNVANDRVTRVLFYDQTLKKGYASLAFFSKLFILRRAFVTLVAYPLSLVCWVFLVLLNLITPVRIYRFKQPQRPGLASVYIEQLEPLCRELQTNDDKGFLILLDASETTNLELLKLYASHFSLYLDDRSALLRMIFALVPTIGFSNDFLKYSKYDTNWELPPAINLKTNGELIAPKIISQLDLEPFSFVLVTHRSVFYDAKYHRNASSELNRSTDISKAEDALLLIHERGLKIVRMGVDTDELPDSLKHLPIIDLSGIFRTDAQDLWLSANCLFMWGINNVGTWHFAHKYNRPTLVTNSYKFPEGYQHTLFTFQLILDEAKNRYLTLDELADLRGVVGRVSEMEKRGLSYVENTPAELLSAVSEMFSCLDSRPVYTNTDRALLSEYSGALVSAGYPPRLEHHSQPSLTFIKSHKSELF